MERVHTTNPEGWLMAPDKQWTMRFHRDQKSWNRFPFFFMDKGRAMPDGSPALLKSRRYLAKYDALELWIHLQENGWSTVDPQWGADLDP